MMILGCEKDEEVYQDWLLNKEWTQSYEEKTSEELELYRPSDYKEFPLSRYRQIFYFDDDNICEYSVLAPNDSHYMTSGSWKYIEKTNSIEIFNSDSELIYELQVVKLSTDLLTVKVN